jgi:uncharacterized alkaline shock family protein YloU
MSETEGQRNYSPLMSERGVTTISDTVVSQLAGMAAQEVEGVHMGGGASRAAGGVLGSLPGSESRTSGISVEIGRTEAAIDLKMGIEYNKNILETVDEVRRRIIDRVESTTGLRIKELNATITDITFPEREARRRLGPATPPSEPEESPQETPAPVPETSTTPEEDEAPEPAEETSQAETTEVESTEAETTEPETAEVETTEAEVASAPTEDSGAPEEEVILEESPPENGETVVEERPPEEGEITELRTEEQPAEVSESETTEDSEIIEESEVTEEVQMPPEPETPEARMRRRAQERARRRRRRAQDS